MPARRSSPGSSSSNRDHRQIPDPGCSRPLTTDGLRGMEAVRVATSSDVKEVAALAREAIGELYPMRGGAVWKAQEARGEPLEEGIHELLADAGAKVVVGTIDDVTVGYGVARLEHLDDGSVLGVVADIFVAEGARGVGVGEVMMGELVSWCRSHGCFGIDAMALPGHRASKNFFEQHGFTARKLVMHHRLTDG